jgi:hypothetical protein
MIFHLEYSAKLCKSRKKRQKLMVSFACEAIILQLGTPPFDVAVAVADGEEWFFFHE